MTVIAYKNGVIASDTKVVDEDGLTFKGQKLFKLSNGTVLGSAGAADDRDIRDILGKASLTKIPSRLKLKVFEITFQGIWLFKTGEVFRVNIWSEDGKWDAEILPVLDPSKEMIAVGSGGPYALGAMLAGKNAVDACKIACKLNNGCGLPIESIKISDI